ncbi:MAG: 16S rRNA (guanine(966)-N(2))-methyltransferase RsmD [Anaerolineae bacterium]|nr:16S rRNA (guanine(966)-N(2))-methyltransferase RsmD [Anaerolineae bacterium]MDH7472416.1 16S rRNA (guanine(966)-N(2))-methyltransferase RsmD [Anaerolineae bacterium]
MRVIAGEARGRRLRSVPGDVTRPITDRVKEALFNILGERVIGVCVLDLFAGTGSVGIEALSRGARRAVFVEQDGRALRTIRENLLATNLRERAEIIASDVFDYLAHLGPEEQFGFVYVAPPQYKGLWARTLRVLDQKPPLTPQGVVVVQIFPKEYEPLALSHLTLTDRRRYGSTLLCFYEPTSEE